MDKKYLRGYILIAFVFIIYSAATIPFPKTAVFGIAFIFSLLAVIAQIYTIHTVMKGQALPKDKVYDFPLVRISILYLMIQLVSSLFLMGFAAQIPVFAAVITEFVILTAAAVGFFAVGAAGKEAVRQDIQLQKDLVKMEELQARINLLVDQCEEEQIKYLLYKLAEEVRYNNPVSGDVSKEIEDEIDVLFTDIEAAALDGDVENVSELCGRMKVLLRERDRICKHGR